MTTSHPDEPDEPIAEGVWYGVARSSALSRRRPLPLTRLGRRIVLWRDADGAALAAPAACPHRHADLGLGRVRDGELECPYHGFRFGRDGACTAVPCEGDDYVIPAGLHLRTLPLREEHGFLWLWHGAVPAALPPVPWIPELPDRTAAMTAVEDTWDVPFSRVVEGLLDLHHVPFAHRKVSPPGYTRLDPYEAHVDDDGVIRSHGTLRKPHEPGSGVTLHLDAVFPATLRIGFGAGAFGAVVACPVDGGRTWIAAHYHQTWLPIPVLGHALTWAFMWSDWKLVLPDDYRMARSSDPLPADPRSECLVPADKAISLWHRARRSALASQRRAERAQA